MGVFTQFFILNSGILAFSKRLPAMKTVHKAVISLAINWPSIWMNQGKGCGGSSVIGPDGSVVWKCFPNRILCLCKGFSCALSHHQRYHLIQRCLELGMLVLHIFNLLFQMRLGKEKNTSLALSFRSLKLTLVKHSSLGMDMAAGIGLRFHPSAS